MIAGGCVQSCELYTFADKMNVKKALNNRRKSTIYQYSSEPLPSPGSTVSVYVTHVVSPDQ